MPINRSYGWRPDRPDSRDIPYYAIKPLSFLPVEIPQKVDLRIYCPPIYDQGRLGSCTAQAIVAAYEMELIKKPDLQDVSLSRLFVYYNTRAMEGTIEVDAGAHIRDGIKTIAKAGAPLESLWPYTIGKFRDLPTQEAYIEALNHQAVLYASIQNNSRDICVALADGYPVIFGFTVYESFESNYVAKSGIATLPKRGERSVGGHAVLAVGYDEGSQYFIVRNSWGTDWGMDGYFFMPYAYFPRLARDFWIIKDIEGSRELPPEPPLPV